MNKPAMKRDTFGTRTLAVLVFVTIRSAVGLPTTVRQICGSFGFASPNAAHCHIKRLSRLGLVRYGGRAGSATLVSSCRIELFRSIKVRKGKRK